jgi:hypothetical protein
MAAIYRREDRELLSWFGIELDEIPVDLDFGRPQPTGCPSTSVAGNAAGIQQPAAFVND